MEYTSLVISFFTILGIAALFFRKKITDTSAIEDIFK